MTSNREAVARYRVKNREKVVEYQRQYNETNREKKNLASAEFRKNNPDKVKAARDKWNAKNPEALMVQKAGQRARAKGMEFTITKEDVFIPEFCPILGLKLEKGTGTQNDCSPSLDRIDTTKGYVSGNVQVISFKANRMKNDATPEQLHMLADWIKKEVSLDRDC